MNSTDICDELRKQRDRIDQAIAALQGSDISRSKGTVRAIKARGPRRLSAAARARIGAAKKAWW